jgi:feruloyl-CoA synthase
LASWIVLGGVPPPGTAIASSVRPPLPRLAPPALRARQEPDGGWWLAHGQDLRPLPPTVLERLVHWAAVAPARPFLAEREANGVWREIGYGAAAARVAGLAAALARRRRPGQCLAIVAANNVEHGLLRLAAMQANWPFVPVSPAYLRDGGGPRLAAVRSLIEPTLWVVEEGTPMGALGGAAVVKLQELAGEAAVGERFAPGAAIPDDPAVIFLTSGSSGAPKAVLTTHRMICAVQQGYAQVWPFLAEHPPVLLDWLPWHHTFGGNDNLHKVLWHGGTLFIDDGGPTATGFERSLANLAEVRPTLYPNVPAAIERLLPALEADERLRDAVFGRLDLVFIAGAGLGLESFRRLRALAETAASRSGRQTAIVSGYGCTEAGSSICIGHRPIEAPDQVGPPLPGLELRLVPLEGRLEVRLRGPGVTPGYWRAPELTAPAFDELGFYRTGDAALLVEPERPELGLRFDGRLQDDFKLTSGTRVAAGLLRTRLMAQLADRGLQDILIVGEGRPIPGAIGFPVPGRAGGVDTRAIAAVLRAWNAEARGSSERIGRFLLVDRPADAASGEVTDKGQLSRPVILRRRPDLLARLFADPPPEEVVVLADATSG